MTNRYQYQTLNPSIREIRLLTILPRDGSEKLRVIPACHIFHASLDGKPKFVALSYVWGDATDKRLILLENSPVLVTKNLYDAMMALRPAREHIVMWIDSLCINQSDDKEKSWQVGLMADIYQQAYKVVAWLGLPDKSSDSVMDYLNSFGAKAEACGIENGPELCLEVWQKLALKPSIIRDQSQSKLIRTPAGKISMVSQDTLHSLFYSISGWHDQNNLLLIAGMRQLFTRPWWGRIWVLQEISLSENAEFVCGTKIITRSRCRAALNAYLALRNLLITKDIESWTPYQRDIVMQTFTHRPNVMLPPWDIYRYSRFSLAALLRATCVGSINLRRHGPHHLESTDPRDKIFALLGLAADKEELKGLGVFPDYTKSCKEIYTRAMAALLQQGHISLFSLCQIPKLQSGLLSWVPDWSRSATDMLQDVKNDHITLYPKFSASEESHNSEVTIVQKDGVISAISVVCHVYDEIYEVGSFPTRASSNEVPLSETFSWPIQWLVEILRLTYYGKQGHGDFSDRLRAAARTSIGGVGYNQNKQLVRVWDDRFFEAVVLLQDGIKYINENHIKLGVQQLLADRAVRDRAKSRIAVHKMLGAEIIGKSLGRLPFVTKKGHLVLSSEYAKRGDFVAVIRGAQVPFILRYRSAGKYQYISEAYVDGIMDGEAIENSKCDRINLV